MTGTPVEDDPRWLDEQERRAWLGLVGIMLRLESALDAQLRSAGLNYFDYGVLAALSESPQRTLRMSVLASYAEGSLSRLSQVVGRLERKGYVHRSPDPADGRYTLATLTEDGYDTVLAVAPGHVQEVRRLVFDPLTKAQVRHLADIGQRILHAIDPDHCVGDRGFIPRH